MAFYRLYSLREGCILSGHDVLADDDREAVALAELIRPLRDRQLWHGSRLVWSLLAPRKAETTFRRFISAIIALVPQW